MSARTIEQEIRSSSQRHPTGPAPIGYRKVNGKNEIDPHSAHFVLLAFALMAQPSTSFRSVHRILLAEQMPAGRGGKVSISTLHRVLRNPYYVGLVQTHGQLVVGDHEALLTVELFNKVQKNKGHDNKFILCSSRSGGMAHLS